MGQKVNPHGFRVGPTLFKGWDSVLYAEKDYAEKLLQDLKIRTLIMRKYKQAQVGRVVIQRPSNNVVVNIYAKKPGMIIGKSGSDIEQLKAEVQKIGSCEVFINIHEIKKPGIDANVTAQTIAQQLESRVSFRKAMKLAIQNCFKQGGKGIKVACSGRLGGAEIARTEWYREGRVPLHTLRADIDYGTAEALTTYGIIGVKVWIYKGESSVQTRR
ncbi:MAG: 30S ribosomal protein S3 [Rickettsiales bacterium]|nr:30S ribosomal protein S3 [Rickettsiales bacterium]MCA0253972.1 30S ribosomal protein S3 [Pseudomonadota bacterium]